MRMLVVGARRIFRRRASRSRPRRDLSRASAARRGAGPNWTLDPQPRRRMSTSRTSSDLRRRTGSDVRSRTTDLQGLRPRGRTGFLLPRRSDRTLRSCRRCGRKGVFIAASAGITCLMRAAMGDIVTAGAADLATALFSECAAIAVAPCPAFVERSRGHADRVDAARHRARRAYRGRPYPRRLAPPQRRRRRRSAVAAHPCAHAKTYEVRRERERTAQ